MITSKSNPFLDSNSPFLDSNSNLNINPLGPLFDRPKFDINIDLSRKFSFTPKSLKDIISEVFAKAIRGKRICKNNSPDAKYFVIHNTAANMSVKQIEKVKKRRLRGKAHFYVNPDGTIIEIWPFTDRNVSATKLERKRFIPSLKKRMFHVELNYKDVGPSYKNEHKIDDWPLYEESLEKPPVPYINYPIGGLRFGLDKNNNIVEIGCIICRLGPTEAQYQALADLYIQASDVADCWPVIVPHMEIDRGIVLHKKDKNGKIKTETGHNDPTYFDYNHFYSTLEAKGVPINYIEKEDPERIEGGKYWGRKSDMIPRDEQQTCFPPILSGDPNKKSSECNEVKSDKPKVNKTKK